MTYPARRLRNCLGALGLACLSGVALVQACSAVEDGPLDAGPPPIEAGSCPLMAPNAGSTCATAVSCVYGTPCQQTIALCTNGQWTTNPPVDAGECPANPPDNGASCSVCGSMTPCAYNLACNVDAGPSVTAVCTDRGGAAAWVVSSYVCGVSDGGARGDAEAGSSPIDAAADSDARTVDGGFDARPADGGSVG